MNSESLVGHTVMDLRCLGFKVQCLGFKSKV